MKYHYFNCLVLVFMLSSSLVGQDLHAFVSDTVKGQIWGVNLDEKKEPFHKITSLKDKKYPQFYVDGNEQKLYYRDSLSIYEYDLQSNQEKTLITMDQPFFNFYYAAHEQLFYFTVERIGSFDLWNMDRDGLVKRRSIVLRNYPMRNLQVYPGPFGNIIWWQEYRKEILEEKVGRGKRRSPWFVVRMDVANNVSSEFSLSDVELEEANFFTVDKTGKQLFYSSKQFVHRSKTNGAGAERWMYTEDPEESTVLEPQGIKVLYEDGESEELYWVDAKLRRLSVCELEGDDVDDRKYDLVREIPAVPYQLELAWFPKK